MKRNCVPEREREQERTCGPDAMLTALGMNEKFIIDPGYISVLANDKKKCLWRSSYKMSNKESKFQE